jgi:hypothetical protein
MTPAIGTAANTAADNAVPVIRRNERVVVRST